MAGRGPNTPRKTAIAVNRKGRRSRTYRPRGSARRVNDWPKGNPANGLQPYRLCLACWQERLTALEVSNFLAHFACPPPRLDPNASGIRTAGPSDRMAWTGWPCTTGCFARSIVPAYQAACAIVASRVARSATRRCTSTTSAAGVISSGILSTWAFCAG